MRCRGCFLSRSTIMIMVKIAKRMPTRPKTPRINMMLAKKIGFDSKPLS